MSEAEPARFPRREFLVAIAGFGSIGAFAWIAGPELPEVMRAANVSLPGWAATTPTSESAYRFAALHPDLLAELPCFCGCVGYQPPTPQFAGLLHPAERRVRGARGRVYDMPGGGAVGRATESARAGR